MYFIYMLGPAGSGKTYLTHALSEWMQSRGLDVSIVNLDPAAEWLPYTPSADIRNYVRADEVMKRYNLGPNGALITSVDLSVNYIDDIREEIESEKPNYVIVDTPGQLEIFAFRVAGKIIIEKLSRGDKTVGIFLLDAHLATQPPALLAMLFLSISSELYLRIPQIRVLSKSDVLSDKELSEVLYLLQNPAEFASRIEKELRGFTTYIDYISLMENLVKPLLTETVAVSAVTEYGLDTLYAAIQRILAGGEDYLTEEPSEIL